jgi:hypothetical protein
MASLHLIQFCYREIIVICCPLTSTGSVRHLPPPNTTGVRRIWGRCPPKVPEGGRSVGAKPLSYNTAVTSFPAKSQVVASTLPSTLELYSHHPESTWIATPSSKVFPSVSRIFTCTFATMTLSLANIRIFPSFLSTRWMTGGLNQSESAQL